MTEEQDRTLRRSKSDRMIAGVCGGFGKFFDIDPVLIRLGFGLAVVFFGTGLLAYLVCWIVIPEEA